MRKTIQMHMYRVRMYMIYEYHSATRSGKNVTGSDITKGFLFDHRHTDISYKALKIPRQQCVVYQCASEMHSNNTSAAFRVCTRSSQSDDILNRRDDSLLVYREGDSGVGGNQKTKVGSDSE